LKKLIQEKYRIPLIFYIRNHNKALGVPGYVFGITSSPFELIHLIIDYVERK